MMITKSETINGVTTITLNRPEKRNAFNPELVESLKQQIQDALVSKETKLIVLEGSEKAFSAGADLAYLQELQNYSLEENLADSQNLADLFLMIYNAEKPTIAVVEGPALAGGCGLALVCDQVLTTENASFGFTEVKIGFIPSIVSTFLIDKYGNCIARELLNFGEVFDVESAYEKGLINKIFSNKEEISKYITRLTQKNSGLAMIATKKLILSQQNPRLTEYVVESVKRNAEARSSEDCKKGIAAFLNKEKISWN